MTNEECVHNLIETAKKLRELQTRYPRATFTDKENELHTQANEVLARMVEPVETEPSPRGIVGY